MDNHNLRIFTLVLAVSFAWITSGSADSWDPANDVPAGATVLSAPTTSVQTNGYHDFGGGDVDWFKAELVEGTTYVFESIGSSDTLGSLYSSTNGSAIVENDDNGEDFSGFNFLLVYTPTFSGTHYILVEEGFFGDDGGYALTYRIATDVWDPTDNNGLGAALRTMDEYEHTEGPHFLVDTDGEDWYRFSLTAGNIYRFESSGNWDTLGRLFSDAAGTIEVANNDDSGDVAIGIKNFRIDYTNTVTGNYYLQISQTSLMENSEAYAKYNFDYKIIEDEWDPSDDAGTGAAVLSPIDETLRTHGLHALSTTDTNDWFKVYLEVGKTYQFESSGSSDPDATLYSDSAGLLQVGVDFDSGPPPGNFQMVYSSSSSAYYYLKVDKNGGGAAVYNLNYSVKTDLDNDGDGMLDSWEVDYLGGTNAMPHAHGDSDIFSNLEEFIAGTDPSDSASYFVATNTAGSNFIVEWTSVAGRQYEVFWTDHLTNAFQALLPVVDYPQNSYTDTTHAAETEGFYKVKVQLK